MEGQWGNLQIFPVGRAGELRGYPVILFQQPPIIFTPRKYKHNGGFHILPAPDLTPPRRFREAQCYAVLCKYGYGGV